MHQAVVVGPKLFAVTVDRIQRPVATRSRTASGNEVLVDIGKSLLGEGRAVCLMTSCKNGHFLVSVGGMSSEMRRPEFLRFLFQELN